MRFVNTKKLLLYYIPLVVLSYIAINHYYNVITKNQLEVIKNEAANDLNAKAILINDMYKYLATDIDIIHWEFKKDFDNDINPNKNKLVDFFIHLSNLQTTYDQVRLIDTLGYEVIRVDFDSINTAKIKEFDELQDKSNRYYFKNAAKLQKEEIYFSNIDLNMEYGVIEHPYKPVLRVAKKIYNSKNTWSGVIVVNYFMQELFDKINTHNNLLYSSFELRNAKGFTLISEDNQQNFSHITSNSDRLALNNTHKNLWNAIKAQTSGSYTQGDKEIYVFKKLIINNKSINNQHYQVDKTLLLIHKIDLDKLYTSQFIYTIYQWVLIIIVSILLLLVLISLQYYNQKLHYQNEQLQNNNLELETLKDKLQNTLTIKQEELKITEKKFYSIFNNAAIGITLVDLEGRPQLANKTLTSITGYTEKELNTKTFGELTHPDHLDVDLEKFDRLISRKVDSYNTEKRYIRKDGSILWADLNVSLLVNEKNEIINVIAAITDITERKEAQEETQYLKKVIESLDYISKVLNINSLENTSEIDESINLVSYIEKQSSEILIANKAREDLLKNLEYKNTELKNYAQIVSHDLKTPLQSIYTLLNWVQDDAKNQFTEEGKMYCQLILENLEKMESLINGILNYSSVGEYKKAEYTINTYDFVTNIVKLMYVPKSIDIKIDKSLPIIKSNKHRMHQVFQNLLQNAINSIVAATGQIEIGAKETPLFWEFYVKDNGKGIDEKYFTKIFELFQSIEQDEKNIGIGLSIVQKVIHYYKGEIWLESEVDKGTTFYFTLPKD